MVLIANYLQASALLLLASCIGASIAILRHSTKRLASLQNTRKIAPKISRRSVSELSSSNNTLKLGDRYVKINYYRNS